MAGVTEVFSNSNPLKVLLIETVSADALDCKNVVNPRARTRATSMAANLRIK
jgi:hypothetical protein